MQREIIRRKSRKAHPLTHERLVELLVYCPETGIFTWRNRHRGLAAGGRAGGPTNYGYWAVRVDGKAFLAGRLAWFYTHQRWPLNEIDHIDHRRDNDAISNLREATRIENLRNTRPKNGKKGVDLHGGKYRARIGVNGKHIHLGTFARIEDAQAAYNAAALTHYGKFAQLGATS